jgi:hypothetical protein
MCFDKSLSRGSKDQDRSEKLELFKNNGISAFYFRSHASFLCASRSSRAITAWLDALRRIGIAGSRLQDL